MQYWIKYKYCELTRALSRQLLQENYTTKVITVHHIILCLTDERAIVWYCTVCPLSIYGYP